MFSMESIAKEVEQLKAAVETLQAQLAVDEIMLAVVSNAHPDIKAAIADTASRFDFMEKLAQERRFSPAAEDAMRARWRSVRPR